jgi:hypothetical protein
MWGVFIFMTRNWRLVLGLLVLLTITDGVLTKCAHAAQDDTNEFVTGVLAVPFKFHLSDKTATLGSTVGGYLGYQTKTWRDLSVTPIVGGGLAMVDQSTLTTQSNIGTGVSVAWGLIGRVGSSGVKGVQLGLIAGIDWLGRGSNYRYEGRPWVAFEVGYNFSL